MRILSRERIEFCQKSRFFAQIVKMGAVFLWGTFWKKSPTPPKNSPKKGIATLGRKCEQRASFFYAFKGSFRSTFMRCRLWFVPLSLVDFFEASPYGVFANCEEKQNVLHKAATRRALARPKHKTATYCTSLGEKAPTPVGAGGGRGALLAVRRRRNNLGVSLLLTFLFAPAVSKRKVAMGLKREGTAHKPCRPCKSQALIPTKKSKNKRRKLLLFLLCLLFSRNGQIK